MFRKDRNSFQFSAISFQIFCLHVLPSYMSYHLTCLTILHVLPSFFSCKPICQRMCFGHCYQKGFFHQRDTTSVSTQALSTDLVHGSQNTSMYGVPSLNTLTLFSTTLTNKGVRKTRSLPKNERHLTLSMRHFNENFPKILHQIALQ